MNFFRSFCFLLSWILLLLLILITIFGSHLQPYPVGKDNQIMLYKDPYQGGKLVNPPVKPNQDFWLGTDHRGYDMISLLLNGMKYTLGFAFAITIGRFALGCLFGLWSGVTGRGKSIIFSLQWLTNSVPAILLLIPILKIISSGPEEYGQFYMDILYILSIIVVGIFPLAYQIRERSGFYNDKLFVVSAKLLGASSWRRIFKHILPSLRIELLYAFLTEYVQVLILMGQLSVFGIFIHGVDRFTLNIDNDILPMSTVGEWSALIAYGAEKIQLYPWILTSVGIFYMATILIIQFFLNQQKKVYSLPTFARKTSWLGLGLYGKKKGEVSR